MLAQRVPTIQPTLSVAEALETTLVYSVAGLLNGQPVVMQRPFRAPHHTSSAVALIGGGPSPKPGEVSLAHHGVLFLDELPEFQRHVIESLRQPLDEGSVTVARAKRSVNFPARFMLVAAMNPCPCGYVMDPRHRCRCPSTKVAAYRAKISGPLLDRLDVQIEVPAVPFQTLTQQRPGESSAAIRARVVQASTRQRKRLAKEGVFANAQMRHRQVHRYCLLSQRAGALLKQAMEELNFSARAYDKVLKISRTIADLAGTDCLEAEHVAEAIQYRSLDRQLWVC